MNLNMRNVRMVFSFFLAKRKIVNQCEKDVQGNLRPIFAKEGVRIFVVYGKEN